jgi:hypothetical protein
MSKLADMAMAIQELHDAAAAIDDVANWLTRQFSSPAPREPEPKPAPTLEQVRAVLAEKSRAGHTAAIRELLRKYGAEKLSLVGPGCGGTCRCHLKDTQFSLHPAPTAGSTARHPLGSVRATRTRAAITPPRAPTPTRSVSISSGRRWAWRPSDPTENLTWFNEEMDDCANGYAAYVLEQVEAAKADLRRPGRAHRAAGGLLPLGRVRLRHRRLHHHRGRHPAGHRLQAWSWRYSSIRGENPQLQCYALGALELFDGIYDIDNGVHDHLPARRDNISTYEISKDDLYRWADEVLKPTAELAFAGDGNFLCGEWCGFCKAKNDCRARAEANLELARYDFKLPPLLTDEDIEDILSRVDDLVSWASDIKEYALQQAVSGKEWHGWKLVEGRSNRRIHNEAAVIRRCQHAGFDPYERKLLGVTAMQKAARQIPL